MVQSISQVVFAGILPAWWVLVCGVYLKEVGLRIISVNSVTGKRQDAQTLKAEDERVRFFCLNFRLRWTLSWMSLLYEAPSFVTMSLPGLFDAKSAKPDPDFDNVESEADDPESEEEGDWLDLIRDVYQIYVDAYLVFFWMFAILYLYGPMQRFVIQQMDGSRMFGKYITKKVLVRERFIRRALKPILLDMLLLTSMRAFLTVVDCTYGDESADYVFLDSDPSVECWKGSHVVLSVIASIFLVALPWQAAKYIVEEASNVGGGTNMVPQFLLLLNFTKISLAATSTLTSTIYIFRMGFSLVLFVILFAFNFTHQPCRGRGTWANNTRSTIYAALIVVVLLHLVWELSPGLPSYLEFILMGTLGSLAAVCAWNLNNLRTEAFMVPDKDIDDLLQDPSPRLREVAVMAGASIKPSEKYRRGAFEIVLDRLELMQMDSNDNVRLRVGEQYLHVVTEFKGIYERFRKVQRKAKQRHDESEPAPLSHGASGSAAFVHPTVVPATTETSNLPNNEDDSEHPDNESVSKNSSPTIHAQREEKDGSLVDKGDTEAISPTSIAVRRTSLVLGRPDENGELFSPTEKYFDVIPQRKRLGVPTLNLSNTDAPLTSSPQLFGGERRGSIMSQMLMRREKRKNSTWARRGSTFLSGSEGTQRQAEQASRHFLEDLLPRIIASLSRLLSDPRTSVQFVIIVAIRRLATVSVGLDHLVSSLVIVPLLEVIKGDDFSIDPSGHTSDLGLFRESFGEPSKVARDMAKKRRRSLEERGQIDDMFRAAAEHEKKLRGVRKGFWFYAKEGFRRFRHSWLGAAYAEEEFAECEENAVRDAVLDAVEHLLDHGGLMVIMCLLDALKDKDTRIRKRVGTCLNRLFMLARGISAVFRLEALYQLADMVETAMISASTANPKSADVVGKKRLLRALSTIAYALLVDGEECVRGLALLEIFPKLSSCLSLPSLGSRVHAMICFCLVLVSRTAGGRYLMAHSNIAPDLCMHLLADSQVLSEDRSPLLGTSVRPLLGLSRKRSLPDLSDLFRETTSGISWDSLPNCPERRAGGYWAAEALRWLVSHAEEEEARLVLDQIRDAAAQVSVSASDEAVYATSPSRRASDDFDCMPISSMSSIKIPSASTVGTRAPIPRSRSHVPGVARHSVVGASYKNMSLPMKIVEDTAEISSFKINATPHSVKKGSGRRGSLFYSSLNYRKPSVSEPPATSMKWDAADRAAAASLGLAALSSTESRGSSEFSRVLCERMQQSGVHRCIIVPVLRSAVSALHSTSDGHDGFSVGMEDHLFRSLIIVLTQISGLGSSAWQWWQAFEDHNYRNVTWIQLEGTRTSSKASAGFDDTGSGGTDRRAQMEDANAGRYAIAVSLLKCRVHMLLGSCFEQLCWHASIRPRRASGLLEGQSPGLLSEQQIAMAKRLCARALSVIGSAIPRWKGRDGAHRWAYESAVWATVLRSIRDRDKDVVIYGLSFISAFLPSTWDSKEWYEAGQRQTLCNSIIRCLCHTEPSVRIAASRCILMVFAQIDAQEREAADAELRAQEEEKRHEAAVAAAFAALGRKLPTASLESISGLMGGAAVSSVKSSVGMLQKILLGSAVQGVHSPSRRFGDGFLTKQSNTNVVASHRLLATNMFIASFVKDSKICLNSLFLLADAHALSRDLAIRILDYILGPLDCGVDVANSLIFLVSKPEFITWGIDALWRLDGHLRRKILSTSSDDPCGLGNPLVESEQLRHVLQRFSEEDPRRIIRRNRGSSASNMRRVTFSLVGVTRAQHMAKQLLLPYAQRHPQENGLLGTQDYLPLAPVRRVTVCDISPRLSPTSEANSGLRLSTAPRDLFHVNDSSYAFSKSKNASRVRFSPASPQKLFSPNFRETVSRRTEIHVKHRAPVRRVEEGSVSFRGNSGTVKLIRKISSGFVRKLSSSRSGSREFEAGGDESPVHTRDISRSASGNRGPEASFEEADSLPVLPALVGAGVGTDTETSPINNGISGESELAMMSATGLSRRQRFLASGKRSFVDQVESESDTESERGRHLTSVFDEAASPGTRAPGVKWGLSRFGPTARRSATKEALLAMLLRRVLFSESLDEQRRTLTQVYHRLHEDVPTWELEVSLSDATIVRLARLCGNKQAWMRLSALRILSVYLSDTRPFVPDPGSEDVFRRTASSSRGRRTFVRRHSSTTDLHNFMSGMTLRISEQALPSVAIRRCLRSEFVEPGDVRKISVTHQCAAKRTADMLLDHDSSTFELLLNCLADTSQTVYEAARNAVERICVCCPPNVGHRILSWLRSQATSKMAGLCCNGGDGPGFVSDRVYAALDSLFFLLGAVTGAGTQFREGLMNDLLKTAMTFLPLRDWPASEYLASIHPTVQVRDEMISKSSPASEAVAEPFQNERIQSSTGVDKNSSAGDEFPLSEVEPQSTAAKLVRQATESCFASLLNENNDELQITSEITAAEPERQDIQLPTEQGAVPTLLQLRRAHERNQRKSIHGSLVSLPDIDGATSEGYEFGEPYPISSKSLPGKPREFPRYPEKMKDVENWIGKEMKGMTFTKPKRETSLPSPLFPIRYASAWMQTVASLSPPIVRPSSEINFNSTKSPQYKGESPSLLPRSTDDVVDDVFRSELVTTSFFDELSFPRMNPREEVPSAPLTVHEMFCAGCACVTQCYCTHVGVAWLPTVALRLASSSMECNGGILPQVLDLRDVITAIAATTLSVLLKSTVRGLKRAAVDLFYQTISYDPQTVLVIIPKPLIMDLVQHLINCAHENDPAIRSGASMCVHVISLNFVHARKEVTREIVVGGGGLSSMNTAWQHPVNEPKEDRTEAHVSLSLGLATLAMDTYKLILRKAGRLPHVLWSLSIAARKTLSPNEPEVASHAGESSSEMRSGSDTTYFICGNGPVDHDDGLFAHFADTIDKRTYLANVSECLRSRYAVNGIVRWIGFVHEGYANSYESGSESDNDSPRESSEFPKASGTGSEHHHHGSMFASWAAESGTSCDESEISPSSDPDGNLSSNSCQESVAADVNEVSERTREEKLEDASDSVKRRVKDYRPNYTKLDWEKAPKQTSRQQWKKLREKTLRRQVGFGGVVMNVMNKAQGTAAKDGLELKYDVKGGQGDTKDQDMINEDPLDFPSPRIQSMTGPESKSAIELQHAVDGARQLSPKLPLGDGKKVSAHMRTTISTSARCDDPLPASHSDDKNTSEFQPKGFERILETKVQMKKDLEAFEHFLQESLEGDREVGVKIRDPSEGDQVSAVSDVALHRSAKDRKLPLKPGMSRSRALHRVRNERFVGYGPIPTNHAAKRNFSEGNHSLDGSQSLDECHPKIENPSSTVLRSSEASMTFTPRSPRTVNEEVTDAWTPLRLIDDMKSFQVLGSGRKFTENFGLKTDLAFMHSEIGDQVSPLLPKCGHNMDFCCDDVSDQDDE